MIGALIHRQHGHLHILDGAQRGQQVKGLEDESHLARTVRVEIDGLAQLGSLEEDLPWWPCRGRPADEGAWICRCRWGR